MAELRSDQRGEQQLRMALGMENPKASRGAKTKWSAERNRRPLAMDPLTRETTGNDLYFFFCPFSKNAVSSDASRHPFTFLSQLDNAFGRLSK
jgi:hypothetical protein